MRCFSLCFSYPVAFEVVSKPTDLFGSDLQLEVGYCGPKPAEPSVDQPMGENTVLSVHGLPEGMMANLPMLKQALKHYIKQTMGYEATSCEIVDGIGYLSFDDVSGLYTVCTCVVFVCLRPLCLVYVID